MYVLDIWGVYKKWDLKTQFQTQNLNLNQNEKITSFEKNPKSKKNNII